MEAMKQTEGNAPAAAQGCCAPAAKSGWLSSRNLLIGGVLLAGAGGLFFGWNWLVAAGFASVIIGVLPCLAMCGLGICASRMGKKQSTPAASAPVSPSEAAAEGSVPPSAASNAAGPQAANRAA